MKDYKETRVYEYLYNLREYLNGDLNQFRKLCEDIERKETVISYQTTSHPDDLFKNLPSNSQRAIVYYRLTIPMALSLFSIIDSLGYLSGSNDDFKLTYKNFKEFFNKSEYPISENESDFINRNYRQGLSHTYFPKAGLGISYHSKNPIDKIIFIRESCLTLNVNVLEKIVLDTFDTIFNDVSLYPYMEVKFMDLVKDYQSTLKKSSKKLNI